MAQYVSKDALVAEMEKLIANGKEKCQQSKENNSPGSYIAWSEHIATCGKILSYINTLEVKEVDLGKEISKELRMVWYGEYLDLEKFEKSAKHFFELGLKAQKGE